MRLIDADELKKEINFSVTITGKDNAVEVKRLMELYNKAINDAPTIDAEPVVRCKDCRHANECHKSVQYTRNEQNTVTIGYLPIEWCSRGERREP